MALTHFEDLRVTRLLHPDAPLESEITRAVAFSHTELSRYAASHRLTLGEFETVVECNGDGADWTRFRLDVTAKII